MTETFAAYAQRVAAGDPWVFLGQLVWYSVSDNLSVEHSDVVAAMDRLGFDKPCPSPSCATSPSSSCRVCNGTGRDRSVYPNVPRLDDVFRRVCTANERRRQPTAVESLYENHLIRDVRRSRGLVVKQLVVETVNSGDQVLDYAPAVQLTYKPGAASIDVSLIDDAFEDNPTVNAIVDQIRADFVSEQDRVTGHAIRDTYRNILLDVHATAVRTGVYFVAQSEAFVVHSLNELALELVEFANLTGRDNVDLTFHALPLIDDQAQRAMLRQAFEDETIEQMHRDFAEIEKMLAGPKITARRAGDFAARMKAVKAKASEYRDLLDDTLDTVGMELAAYELRMVDLLNHTKD